MQIKLCSCVPNWLSKLMPGVCLMLVSMTAPAETLASQRQAELHNMLVQDCGSCHGLTFKGGLGTPLLPESLEGKPRDYLINAIMEGRPGTAMPPWKFLLSRQEAEWMLDKLLASKQP